MTTTERACALAALDRQPPERTWLVDFDHTLLGANSTEAFLAQARPKVLIAILLTLIDILKPWRLLPARRDRFRAWRDVLRVRIVTTIDPGLWRRWREERARRTARLLDPDLVALAAARPAHVVTLGFEPIVKPILEGSGLERRLVAMPLAGGAQARDAGKCARCEESLGPAVLREAVVVTDDLDADGDLVAIAAGHVPWPKTGDAAAAFDDAYLPMRYANRVKRPGLHHLRRIVIGEDAATLCIATIFASANGWEAAPAAILATLALASVYDIGYAENDRLGRMREAKPRTPQGWDRWSPDEINRGACFGAAVFAAPAVALMVANGSPFVWTAGALLAMLALTRIVFALFNRTPVAWRLPPFLALQALKSFGLAVALGLTVTPAGAALLASVAVGRAVPYAIYRRSGSWWNTPDQLIRIGLFAIFLGAAVAIAGTEALDLSAALGAAWCLQKARLELQSAAGGWRSKARRPVVPSAADPASGTRPQADSS